MPMDENAMYKALLKNKPQPRQTQAAKEIKENVPAAQPVKPHASASGTSEDAMYNALLKNRPPAPKPPVRVEPRPEPAPPVMQAVAVREEPVVRQEISHAAPVQPASEDLQNLTATVNQVQSLLKTVFMVLILTLLVEVAILIKMGIN